MGVDKYLSVNDACGYGEPNTLVTGILLIPIMLVVAFVLPGNTILPMADLCALPYMVEVFVAYPTQHRKERCLPVRSGSLWAWLLRPFSHRPFAGRCVPASSLHRAAFTSSASVLCAPLIAGLFYAFWSQNPIIIGAVVIAYFRAALFKKKNKCIRCIHLENAAAAYSAYWRLLPKLKTAGCCCRANAAQAGCCYSEEEGKCYEELIQKPQNIVLVGDAFACRTRCDSGAAKRTLLAGSPS